MSKGPGKTMRVIAETTGAHPARRYTLAELAALAYPGAAIERSHLVAVSRAVRCLEAAKRVSFGSVKPIGATHHVKTVRAFDPPSLSVDRAMAQSMMTSKTQPSAAKVTALATLVEKIIAEDPFQTKDGLKWAARPQSFYCAELGISPATLRRLISKPPFVRAWKMVGGGLTVISGTKQVSGPKKMCVLRTGEAPSKDIADEAKRVMITLWNKTIGKRVTWDEGKLLWGMARDMMKMLAELGLPADAGGELAIAVFKYALADWQAVAAATKIEAEATPGYKTRFYAFPSISNVRRFHKAAVYAYVAHLQETKAAPPAGLKFLSVLNVSAAITTHTDPAIGHPGLTPAIEAAIEGGYAAAAKKALAAPDA
jgi:hypothetical protein